MHAGSAFANREPAPLASQGLAGRPNRIVDQVLIGFGDLRDHATVRWVHIGELPLPAYEPPVDIIQD